MSTVKKPLNRYQNPELFERLAMEYAIGMLHGRARKRFETLMQQHLYLRATVDAYEHKFSHLVDILPEQTPNRRVWRKIKKQTHQHRIRQQGLSWWKSLPIKVAGVAVSLVLATSLMFMFFLHAPVNAYVSVLESNNHIPMVMATAKKGEGIAIHFINTVDTPEDMQYTLWCLPKAVNAKPMMMGTLTQSGKSIIKMDSSAWQNLADVQALAISLEPKLNNQTHPSGKILYQGNLQSMLSNS
jgi:anti-sigma-K factor RskA